ncbi:hypothetical protein [Klugiella xanthotipulae]|uniref:hypothetical protein n=1 Tax=Klugiella xanthotipulae TaxID=244735 RepID=UPI00114D7457|nr:hypothetical protein [Klugiella xanthotipulae]
MNSLDAPVTTPASVSFSAAGWYFLFYTPVICLAIANSAPSLPGIVALGLTVIASAGLAVLFFVQARSLRNEARKRSAPERSRAFPKQLLGGLLVLAGSVYAIMSASLVFSDLVTSTAIDGGNGGLGGAFAFVRTSLVSVSVLALGAMLVRAGSRYPGRDGLTAAGSHTAAR